MGIFADFRVNVASGELGGDSGDKVYLSAPGLLIAQFQAIEKSLHKVPGVEKVRRIDLIPSERRHFELDTLLAHITEPVLSVDRDGRIIAANLAAAKSFGVSHDQLAGMQLQRFLPRLQLAELLRGFTVPRYGLPVTVRGRDYRLDWSPMSLAESQEEVESLAGAVLTLQAASPAVPGAALPDPRVLWDFDRRREVCLRLQQLAPYREPLLILGEKGTGKSTFAAAAFYLSPLADTSGVYWQSGDSIDLDAIQNAGEAVLVLDDLHRLSEKEQAALAAALMRGLLPQRVIATANTLGALLPALQQLLCGQLIRLPPLRTMRPALARLCGAIQTERGQGLPMDGDTLAALATQDWPTNLSGLKEQLAAACDHAQARQAATITVEDLPLANTREQLPWTEWGRGLSYRQMMEKIERALLQEFSRGHPSTRTLARRLGLSHTAIANKLRKFGLGDGGGES